MNDVVGDLRTTNRKHRGRKFLGLFLSVLMVLQTVSFIPVLAADYGTETSTPSEIIDLTNVLYGNNFVPSEEVAAIRAMTTTPPAIAVVLTDTVVSWQFATNAAVNNALVDGGQSIPANSGSVIPAPALRFYDNIGVRILAGGSSAINAGSGLQGLYGVARWAISPISTQGLTDIEVTWAMRTTTTGPRDWQLQYSINGTDWNNIGTMVQISQAAGNPNDINYTGNQFTRMLPQSAEDVDTLYLRWLMATNYRATPGGDGYIAATGTIQINNISIRSGVTTEPSASVGQQTGTLTGGTGGSAMFNVTTANIAEDTPITLNANALNVTINTATVNAGGTTQITVNTTDETPHGTHQLTLTVGTVQVNFNLVVGEPVQVMAISAVNAATVGAPVTIEGIAVGTPQLAGGGAQNRTIVVVDGTGATDGIQVDAGGANISAYIGQRIQVTGTLAQFNNVNQIATTTSQIESLETGVAIVPVPIAATQLAPPNFRSMLVSIERVQVLDIAGGGGAPANAVLVGTAGGQRIELRLVGGVALPNNIEDGDWIEVQNAVVGWFNARSAVQLLNATISGTTAPAVLPVTANPPSETVLPENGGDVVLTSATAGAAIRYRINGGTWQTGTNPVTLAISATDFVNHAVIIEAYATYNSVNATTTTFTYNRQRAFISVREARETALGQVVTVRGIVTNFYETGANLNNSFFLQDPTGTCELSGIHVRLVSANAGISPNTNPDGARHFVGHLVEVTGVRQLPTATNGFQGVDNIMTAGAGHGVTIIQENVSLPTAVPVQLSDLVTAPGQSRPYSSMMVSVARAQIHSRVTTGPGNFPLRDHDTGLALTIDGNTFIVNPLPLEFQAGDWVTINRANVHWWHGRSEVQLRLIDQNTDIQLAPPPPDVIASPATGSALPIGGTVTLSVEQADWRIRYSVNGGVVQTSDSNTVTVTIPAFDQYSDTAVIEAYTILPDGVGGYFERTEERIFTYTQAVVAAVIPSHLSGGTIRPGTQIFLQTATEGAEIHVVLTRNVGLGNEYTYPSTLFDGGIVLTENMFPVTITAYASATGFINSPTITLDYTMRQVGGEQIFFGQMHAHTTMSDGQGTPEFAFAEARDIAQLDFFLLSDHSNWFDWGYVSGTSGSRAGINDGPEIFNLREYNRYGSYQWVRGNVAAANAMRPGNGTTYDFIASNGFEFTWSGGPGHINTFNTTGWVCRRNLWLNDSNHDNRLRRYYDLLRNTPESVSLFAHPGLTFGNFDNFAHFDPEIALRIPLIEVANGEGAIGAGGYFPSYEQFTMALDRGWLLAPVNSQDNHRGRFGWANEGRAAIYTNNFTYEGMWQAFRDRAVYSTEIRDMEIRFHVNGEPMGTVMHTVPEIANFTADIYVPLVPRNDGSTTRVRDTYTIRRVSLITNGGVELAVQYFDTPVGETAEYRFTMQNPEPGFYYLWVIAENSRGQERIAVTAPVWLGRAPIVGITDVSTETFMPVTTEELTIDTRLFNDEGFSVTLISLEYSVNGVSVQTVLHDTVIPSGSSLNIPFNFTPSTPGINRIVVRAIMEVGGTYRYYYGFLDLNVHDIDTVTFIGIDGSHFNEYVDGNQRGSFTNFARLAASMNIVTVVFRNDAELINAANDERFGLLVMAPPGRHGGILSDPDRGEHRSYSEAAVQAVADFALRGGIVAVVGFGNFNDQGSLDRSLENAMSWQQNRLLAAMGSNIRVGDTSHSSPAGFTQANMDHQHHMRWDYNFNLDNPFMANIHPQGHPDFPAGQYFRNFSTGALYVVNDSTAMISNAADTTQYVVYGDIDLYGLFGVDVMVLAHPGSWTMDSHAQANNGWGRYNDTKWPNPGANFPRYAHPTLGLLPAPAEGTGEGQRPTAGGRDDGQHLIAASQEVGTNGGVVLVFASHFFSNFDVQFANDMDFYGQLPDRANTVISENIFRSLAREVEITDIAYVRQAAHGEWFAIEGIVTSGLQITGTGSEENRGFMNTVYIQDDTGGINLFEVTEDNLGGLQVGQLVRARGFVSAYQGETQLTVHLGGSVQIIDTDMNLVTPMPMYVVDILSPVNTGRLIRAEGVVSSVIMQPAVDGADEMILQFTLTDSNNDAIYVYMRGYITPNVCLGFVEYGATVSVIGFASIGELAYGYGDRIRVRDRNEIELISPPPIDEPTVTSINVTPATGTIQRNQQQQFSATVIGTNNPPQTVTWSVEGSNISAGTTISATGLLTIAPDQAAGTLTIRAISTHTITVSGTAITTVTVPAPTPDPSDPPIQGGQGGPNNVRPPRPPSSSAPANVTTTDTTPTPETPIEPEPSTPTLPPPGVPTQEWINPFIDVSIYDWFFDSVRFAHQNNLFSGTSATTFSPNATMTRGMMATVLHRMAGTPQVGSSAFVDVPDGRWYSDAINWAAATGIVSGFGDGRFGPNDDITREQMALILSNYARVMGYEFIGIRTGSFNDEALISAWALQAVNAMYNAGIINGRGNGDFDPQGNATRAEVATLLRNFLEVIKEDN